MVSQQRSIDLLSYGFVIALAVLTSPALLAEASIQLSTEQPEAGVPFSIIIEADAATVTAPDLTPLNNDFKVLNSRTSQHIILQNGKRSRSSQWVITLVRDQAGKVQVPPLSLGTETTPALAIEVQPAPDLEAMAANAAWLELELQPQSPYVQQQTKLVVRVMRRQGIDLDGATLSAPEFSGGDVVIEAIDKDKAYRVDREGQSLDVIERTYFLYPQSSGEIVLKPMELVERIVEGATSLFDPMGTIFRSVRLTTPPDKLLVKPAPESSDVTPWLPAEELLLTEAWSFEGDELAVGAAVTRTMGLLARGLTAAQLPDLTPQLPIGLRVYPEQPVLNNQKGGEGLVGSRTLKLTILASEPGEYQIPEVKVPWFNLISGKVELATLPARVLRVVAPKDTAQASSALEGSPLKADTSPEESNQNLPVLPIGVGNGKYGWSQLLVGLSLGLALGVLLSHYLRRASPQPSVTQLKQDASNAARAKNHAAWRQAIAAAKANQAETCRRAIVTAAPRWLGPGVQPRSLSELAQALPPGPLASEVNRLAATLYAKPSAVSSWDGRELALALQRQPLYRPVAPAERSSALASVLEER